MKKAYKSYFRPVIAGMSGYTPGEQPKLNNLIKLNTNENPYPPAPGVFAALKNLDAAVLRRYPDPLADELCNLIVQRNGLTRDMVIAANGSDDVLTMVFRAFTAPNLALAVPEPTYSLYPILAQMQNAPVKKIALQSERDFALPEDFLQQAQGANLLILARPNAPTGNSYALAQIRHIIENFDGVVLIDEAYADFADDNCLALVREYPNLLVSRTMSKSYSLAGLRLGYAVGNAQLIAGLYKVKDSYNVDRVAQLLAVAAYKDEAYLAQNCAKIKASRQQLTEGLQKIGFTVVPSQTNFVFAAPGNGDGEAYFKFLRDRAVVVRYFAGAITGKYVRISVGTDGEMARLLELSKEFCACQH